MATHAHDLGNSFSAAKQGGVAVAVITTVGGIIVAALNLIGVFDKGPPPSTGPTPTTISNPTQQTSPLGSMDKVEINAAGRNFSRWMSPVGVRRLSCRSPGWGLGLVG